MGEGRLLMTPFTAPWFSILEQKGDHGDYFGVAFSTYHAAVVGVVRIMHTTAFSHKSALPTGQDNGRTDPEGSLAQGAQENT